MLALPDRMELLELAAALAALDRQAASPEAQRITQAEVVEAMWQHLLLPRTTAAQAAQVEAARVEAQPLLLQERQTLVAVAAALGGIRQGLD